MFSQTKKNVNQIEQAELTHIEQGVASTFSNARRSRSEQGKTIPKARDFETKDTSSRKESYVGRTGEINKSTSSDIRNSNLPKFEIINAPESRYTPWSKTIDTSGSSPRMVIQVNRAHKFVANLLDAKPPLVAEVFTTASAWLLGSSCHGKTDEEIFNEIQQFGETYVEIVANTELSKKRKTSSRPTKAA